MNKTKIFYKNVKLKDPILVVGLPGIGSVGSLVGEHLKNALDAKRFATVQSPHFPHEVVMLKKGGMRLVNNRFYYYKNTSKGHDARDIVLLLGDVQAVSTDGQYEVNDKIVRFFKSLGGKTIYTVGGYNLTNRYVQKPRVFAVASSQSMKKYLSKQGVIFGEAAGMIIGSAGMIAAFAKRYKIDSACIMGETGLIEVDANAAKSVLEVLSKVLGVKLDLSDMDKIRKETERLIREMETVASGAIMPPPSKDSLTYIR